MTPEARTILLVCLLLPVVASAGEIRVTGESHSGMRFSGKVAAMDAGTVHLDPEGRATNGRIGIPVATIARVSLAFPQSAGPELAHELEALQGLISQCDTPSIRQLLDWVARCAEAGDWTTAYLWSGRLAETAGDPTAAMQARLLQARALDALGLYRELAQMLEEMNATVAPLEAPLELCRLNAESRRRAGDATGARFWAELPALRVPAGRGPEAARLAHLADELARAESDNLHPPQSP
jgi:hypothetical protein